jgi:hypothetical protein
MVSECSKAYPDSQIHHPIKEYTKMEPTKKEPTPPAPPNKPTEERGERDRLKRTADEMARRGIKRQHKGEVGKTFPR